MFGGGGCVHMRVVQIYIQKHQEQKKIALSWGGGGVVSQLGVLYPPRGDDNISLLTAGYGLELYVIL